MSSLYSAPERFVYNDGGRAAAGFEGWTGDCTCRAIAIATGKPYQEVHDGLSALSALFNNHALRFRSGRQHQRRAYAEHLYLRQLGWQWTATNMARLHRCDLPPGRLIVAVNQHLVALIDNVVHDHGEHYWRDRRVVHGYFTLNEQEPAL
jgi:hypothetical protein